MDRFVNYDDVGAAAKDQLADHALVLMFVPLFEDWVQPIAGFSTKGAAPGKVLLQLVLSAILKLEKNNASIIGVITDGAGSNRYMWSQLGVSGKLNSERNSILNPCDPSRKIFFLCDVPHIVKCIRNHQKKRVYGQV
ncbi:hypothetical protein HPB47_003607 [Ixodes persulcatus]|uniref:Uncharacterized protein n=1 Tax=Ixodes persulcatus TaxID=34615 RepID=A0AC60PJ20_IXOPE|nr:hypothetical protein HPB47_003607 [Ixodes persulcatus]